MRDKVERVFRVGLYFILGLVVGVLATVLYNKTTDDRAGACTAMYPLTSQSLDCAGYKESFERLHALQSKLDDAVPQYLAEKKAIRISVWVRDLITKQWAAENENELYDPASLIKLPLAIALYKTAEVEPSILAQRLTYTQKSGFGDNTQDFAPAPTLTLGNQYSVLDLIKAMLINSDNNAKNVLMGFLDSKIFSNTLLDLGIAVPSDTETHDFITVKSYANIFRTLYNASYLDRKDSQATLNLLSQEAFKGIRDPLPSKVTVAHKFGEREFVYSDGSVDKRQLHDCGIVYKGDNPYSICIMTEGADFNQLLSIIKDMSLIVYKEM